MIRAATTGFKLTCLFHTVHHSLSQPQEHGRVYEGGEGGREGGREEGREGGGRKGGREGGRERGRQEKRSEGRGGVRRRGRRERREDKEFEIELTHSIVHTYVNVLTFNLWCGIPASAYNYMQACRLQIAATDFQGGGMGGISEVICTQKCV